jgi:hypothetical protein
MFSMRWTLGDYAHPHGGNCPELGFLGKLYLFMESPGKDPVEVICKR